MIYEIKHPEVVEHIFEGWQETLIWSCLQNIMGHLYADSKENPISAMALLGDFCFFAGKPNKELVRYKPEWCEQESVTPAPFHLKFSFSYHTAYPTNPHKPYEDSQDALSHSREFLFPCHSIFESP